MFVVKFRMALIYFYRKNVFICLLPLFLLFGLVSCQQEGPPKVIQSAFYHWQTELSIDSTEASYLKLLNTKRLYVKFFDVDWDATRQQAIPKASLQTAHFVNENQFDIVPTIFITNQTFKQLSTTLSDELSAQVWDKIQRLMPGVNFKEIQIDCDWTQSTRAAFFLFLEQFRKQIPTTTQLSATIRLHQYRYPEKTGIPPVDRGVLMFYNMGDLQDWDEPNSILNLEKAKPYLQGALYPIHLDVALPIFRWGVLFREGKMIKLINRLDEKSLVDTNFYEVLPVASSLDETSRYRLKKSTYLDGYYLYKDDEIRLEGVPKQRLKEAAFLLKNTLNSDTTWLSFYHLDTPLLDTYNYAVFEKCVDLLSSSPQ